VTADTKQPNIQQFLIVMAKYPVLGRVKTRIAAEKGDMIALEIYQELLRKTFEIAQHKSWKTYWYWDEVENLCDELRTRSTIQLPPFNRFNKQEFFHKLSYSIQTKGDLGKKLSSAMQEVYSLQKTLKKNKVILIGSDCPDISTSLLENAFHALNSKDFVIGPSKDGGYYLIGMNHPFDEVFENIPWSTEIVFQETINRFFSLGKSFHILPTLSDIDHWEDWNIYKSR
jgi:rSAM/selenodomain-associated transferase 1